MENNTLKRNIGSVTESSVTESSEAKEGEKTIPFLRRLRDMLRENVEVISFYPGVHKDGVRLLGKIVVHDRARVESEILPRYFSHSSFASLRRQLNYFAFTRIGKGRQPGATYCNEGVIELDDILHLKRRPVGSTADIAEVNQKSVDLHATAFEDNRNYDRHRDSHRVEGSLHSRIRDALVPFVHLPRSRRGAPRESAWTHHGKKIRLYSKSGTPQMISPLSTPPMHSSDEESDSSTDLHQRVVLDLTTPTSHAPTSESDYPSSRGWQASQCHFQRASAVETSTVVADDADILAGCSALLMFSHGGPH